MYASCGAVQPRRFKPDGGTGLLSDLFFVGHYLQMVEVLSGEVARVEPNGLSIEADESRYTEADVIIKCVGFHPNVTTGNILNTSQMSGVGLVDDHLWVKGEPHIDNGPATASPLAHSIIYIKLAMCTS